MSMIFDLLPPLTIIIVAFACGYALREYIARRRRDAERKKSMKNILSSDHRNADCY
jgi:hypothetical protein